jgi:undecaprenyl-diphosphatase
VTEFAPVSSSGHLILVPWLFNWTIVQNPALNKTFDVALHMGTLLGGLVYFWRDIVRYAKAFVHSIARRSLSTPDEKMAWALVIGTIPGALAGALFESAIEDKLGQPWLIASMLAVFGVVLYVVDVRAPSRRSIEDAGVGDGLKLGVAQALALQPGVSRSGITITAGRLLAFDRESAARFSFLLALPVIFGAGVFKSPDIFRNGLGAYSSEFLWGFVSSAVSGFIVIWGLLRYLRTRTFFVFMVFRLAVAALVFALIISGVRTATI